MDTSQAPAAHPTSFLTASPGPQPGGAMTMPQPAVPSLGEHLAETTTALERLGVIISQFEDRLGPVMRSPDAAPEAGTDAQPARSVFGAESATQAHRVHYEADRLLRLIDRIDL